MLQGFIVHLMLRLATIITWHMFYAMYWFNLYHTTSFFAQWCWGYFAGRVTVGAVFFNFQFSNVGMENAFKEYRAWIEGDVDAETQRTYNKALSVLEELRPFEKSLVNASALECDVFIF